MSIDELRARLEAAGFWVSPDGRVAPDAVSTIVGRSEKTLRTWRAAGEVVIPFTRIRGRVTYALADVLHFIEANGVAGDR
ncbi:DNA-binding protein [Luteimonas aestuarii]|uniref:DNA-binding protein n=1 Tax=Luteimonas aestuarii TaxID=453837 RepID=A0A4R5TYA2_9GAMM|nr:helix-turn-helix domain-containing protein [Luteimonas aestuarii]TDK26180.1 DNA-binding protein [Luteimonas aestuarii]